MTTVTTPELVEAVLAASEAGHSQVDIARDLGVSQQTVSRIARMYGNVTHDKSSEYEPHRWDDQGPDLSWQDAAACRSLPGFTEMPAAMQQAWCAGCPVRDACLGWALVFGPPFAVVQGGKSPAELRDLYRSGQTAEAA